MTITFPPHITREALNAILALDRSAIVTWPDGTSEVKDIPAFLMKEPT